MLVFSGSLGVENMVHQGDIYAYLAHIHYYSGVTLHTIVDGELCADVLLDHLVSFIFKGKRKFISRL